MFDAPASASSGLKAVVHAEPDSVDRHWRDLISAAAAAAALDPGIDHRILRDVLHCTLRQVGGMVWERDGAQAADCTTSILLDGLAAPGSARPGPGGASAAVAVVEAARARWAAEAQQRARDRRGAILDTARDQFALRGFEATTVRDIADAAGLPAGNLYRYYKSKDAMVAAILAQFSDRLLEAYQAVLAAGAPAVESLEAICWLLDQAGDFSREIDMLKGHARVLTLDVASHYRDGAAARYSMLVGLIEAGVAAGSSPGPPTLPWWPPACARSCGRRCGAWRRSRRPGPRVLPPLGAGRGRPPHCCPLSTVAPSPEAATGENHPLLPAWPSC